MQSGISKTKAEIVMNSAVLCIRSLTLLFSGALVAQRKGHPVEGRQARNELELLVMKRLHLLLYKLCRPYRKRLNQHHYCNGKEKSP